MKKTLLSLLTLLAISTSAWADISTTELDAYLKASGEDIMLSNMQKQIKIGLEYQAKMRGETLPPKLLEAISNIMTKNLSKFSEGMRSLDKKDYKSIMKFYATDLGRKVAEMIRQLDMVKMQKEMIEFAKKEISPKRKELLAKLAKADLSEERQLEMARESLLMRIKMMPKEMQEGMKKDLDNQLAQIKPMIKQQVQLTTAYTYRDYSNSEIVKITNYLKTPSAQAENRLIEKGMSDYMKAVTPETTKLLQNWKEKGK